MDGRRARVCQWPWPASTGKGAAWRETGLPLLAHVAKTNSQITPTDDCVAACCVMGWLFECCVVFLYQQTVPIRNLSPTAYPTRFAPFIFGQIFISVRPRSLRMHPQKSTMARRWCDVSVCDSFLTIVQARISRRWKTLPRLPAQILCENREPDHNDVATDLRAISCQWWCVRKQKSLSVFMGDFYSNVMPV